MSLERRFWLHFAWYDLVEPPLYRDVVDKGVYLNKLLKRNERKKNVESNTRSDTILQNKIVTLGS